MRMTIWLSIKTLRMESRRTRTILFRALEAEVAVAREIEDVDARPGLAEVGTAQEEEEGGDRVEGVINYTSETLLYRADL